MRGAPASRRPTRRRARRSASCPPGTRAGEFVAAQAAALGLGAAAGRRTARETPPGPPSGPTTGTYRFTIGQRRGIGVAASERLYVLSVDAAANRVVVGPGRELDASRGARSRASASSPELAAAPLRVGARVRHRAEEVAGHGPSGTGRRRADRLRRARSAPSRPASRASSTTATSSWAEECIRAATLDARTAVR